jgi:hypothetical protein
MPAEEVERFEAAAGGLLDELGYARAVPHPRPEILDHATILREGFHRRCQAQEFVRPGAARALEGPMP